MADMWQHQFGAVDKPAHMKEMLALTTRMNALARVTLGNVNIAATTALQVGPGSCGAGQRWVAWAAGRLKLRMTLTDGRSRVTAFALFLQCWPAYTWLTAPPAPLAGH